MVNGECGDLYFLFMKSKKGSECLLAATIVEHAFPVNMQEDDRIDFEEGRSYTTNDVFIHSLGKAMVSPDSVELKNGLLVKESLVPNANKSYYQSRYLIKKLFFAKRTILDRSKYLLATDSWSAGHFHWFCDVLPKLLCIKDRAKEFKLLLPDSTYTRTVAVSSLQRLGFDFEDIVWMNEKNFYRVKDLYYVSNVSNSGQLNPGLMKTLQEQFNAGRSGAGRIYISREKAQ